MLLPNGRSVRVGWAVHEEIWVRAANTLRGAERKAAYEDIAALTGRGVWSVEWKGAYLRRLDRDAAKALLANTWPARRIMVIAKPEIRGPRQLTAE